MSKEIPNDELILEEYKSLRDETIKRVEMNQNIINLNFIAIGGLAFIGNALQGFDMVLLLYPLLSMFFTMAYASNVIVLVEIGNYIREGIETKVWELRWARYFRDRNPYSKIRQEIFINSIFVIIPIICLVASIFIEKAKILNQTSWWILFLLGCFSVAAAFWTLRSVSKHHPAGITEELEKIEAEKQLLFDGRKLVP